MKKIEFIWRHLLYETIEKRQTRFEQQELARQFSISSSTVNASLATLRRMGAVSVGGRGFRVVDYEKILYLWANERDLSRDIRLRFSVALPILEIEGQLPPETIPTAYTAMRERFGEPPADYDKIYVYTNNPDQIRQRFVHEIKKGQPNFFILEPDPFLSRYGSRPPLGQLFVDLWNLTDWYAKDFVKNLKEEIDGLLS